MEKRKHICTLLLLLMASMQATWGQKIVLHMTDKQTVEYNISQLDSISFLEGTNEEIKEEHEWVDLGLPSGTLWATCNVGANSPEDYGDYFAWGETEPKNDYSWSTYKYSKGTNDTMTKYCNRSSYGTVDSQTVLEPSDDAATVNWGSDWQMPSDEQFDELDNSSYITTSWTTVNGKYGWKITSKSNGNFIFLPAAGYRDDTNPNDTGSTGYYWSRSLDTYGCYYACVLEFRSYGFSYRSSSRCYGQSVRPVRVQK